MNNGDDLAYYLKKGTKVVGVEANPELCTLVEKRFADEIQNGSLIVLNCILTTENTDHMGTFYIHQNYHVLSQFPRPDNEFIDKFKPIEVSQRTASSIILEHGHPYFVKIDLEHYDQYVLSEIFSNKIKPDFVSVEMHDFVVYDILKETGYRVFNTVDGETVPVKYNDVQFLNIRGGNCTYSFPYHSAGPFGSDITQSPWRTRNEMDLYLKNLEPGWIDLHAALQDPGVT